MDELQKCHKNPAPDMDISENKSQIAKHFIGKILIKILKPRGKQAFYMSIKNNENICVLDVGCGNNSVHGLKSICSKVHYIGLDVENFNQSDESISEMDEYIVVSPDNFAEKIESMQGKIDAIISAHNLEHCNEPQKVLLSMIKSLKKNGTMYLSFPSEESINFPHRGGTLNFYDDPSHKDIPKYADVINILKNEGMTISYSRKQYQPFIMKIIGRINERKSNALNHVLSGTWAYYGFESVIWARKI